MTKLALFLLAVPACSTFAAADYSTLISSSGNFSKNDVTPNTLLAAGDTTLGTASDPNENHIGWSTTPGQQLLVVWTADGPRFSGTNAPLDLGGATSYNTLSLDDVVKLTASTFTMGQGALVGGTGADAALVDTSKLANNNVINVSGAGYQTSGSKTVSTLFNLISSGTNYVGYYGNNNTVNITGGAQIVADASSLVIGASDAKNPTYGSNNAVNVSGSVSISVIGQEGIIASYLSAPGLTVGDYGSNNALTVSDKANANVGGNLYLGKVGDKNTITISNGASLTTSEQMEIGYMPDATENVVTVDNSTLTNTNNTFRITVGRYGSNNSLAATNSAITSSALYIGVGDTAGGEDAVDGTAGFVATEGCGNTLLATDSLLKMRYEFMIGGAGSNNTGTISGSGLYYEWTDTGTTPDGKVQYDEITTGINSIAVGVGFRYDDSMDYTVFGRNNSLTIDNASAFKAVSVINVGEFGSGNSLTIKGGSVGSSAGLFMGIGHASNIAFGSNNTVTITGEDSKLTTNGANALQIGMNGSNNKLLISAGATFASTAVDTDNYIGKGLASTADKDNSAFGSGNSLVVTGEGSSATLASNQAIFLGNYGSNNKLEVSDKAKVSTTCDIYVGAMANQFGSVLDPKNVYSQGNEILVSGGATLTIADDLFLGYYGINNSMVVTGEDTYVQADDINVGYGSLDTILFGSGNSLEVTDNAVLVGDSIAIGQNLSADFCGTNNMLTVSDGGIVVATDYVVPNNFAGEKNIVRIKNGTIALPGKVLGGTTISWEDLISNGFTVGIKGKPSFSNLVDGTSFVDKGAIQVWDATAGKYVTAKATDLSIKYYSSEAEAKAATGYEGLAGYTILTQANDLSRLEWAGDVYDGGNGSYCSSWYGWFYNNEAYGDYIMSCNNNAWQYVEPSSTPQSTYLYDYSLNSWLYTDETNFQDRGVYNYSTAAWMRLGK